jgi:hypothetical protein
MRRAIWTPIVVATLICGTLDILLAVMLTLTRGKAPADMLRFVASGPFPDAVNWGAAGSILGLVVHYTLMAVMVAWFVIAARNVPALTDKPWLAGLIYGLITYAVMNLVVLPLRFPAAWPPKPMGIATQLFAHIVLVGLPTAYITRRYVRG